MTAPGGVAVRYASGNDAELLSAFSRIAYIAAFGAHFTPDDLAAHLEATLSPDSWRRYLVRDRVLLAEVEGVPAGYLQIEPTHPRGAFFHRLYVEPTRLGQGIGSMLLRAGLDDPVVRVAPQAAIDVWEHNAGAIRLYEKFGFVATGERMPDFVTASGDASPGDLIMVRKNR